MKGVILGQERPWAFWLFGVTVNLDLLFDYF